MNDADAASRCLLVRRGENLLVPQGHVAGSVFLLLWERESPIEYRPAR